MANVNDHIFWLLIVAVLCAGVSIVLAYMSKRASAPVAFAALLLAYLSHFITVDTSSLWFWGAATLIVIGINILLPPMVRDSKVGVSYLATGAMAGAFIGMLLNSVAGVILASAVGVALAGVAFSRLNSGRVLEFPSRKFFNYLCAKGLPLVVIFSMLGILSLQLIVIGAAL